MSHQPAQSPGSGFLVHGDQPLIGLVSEENGQEVVIYFTEEQADGQMAVRNSEEQALGLAGAWQDLNWEEMQRELDRIRHETPPSPPLVI